MADKETETIKYFRYLEEFEKKVEKMIELVEKQRKKKIKERYGSPKKEDKEYRTVRDILEDLTKAQAVIDKLWFELWRMYE